MTEELIYTQTTTNDDSDNLNILYGWANESDKTWYLTTGKFCSIKGSRLLMIYGAQPTALPVKCSDTMPCVDDVVADMKGNHWIIKTADWA